MDISQRGKKEDNPNLIMSLTKPHGSVSSHDRTPTPTKDMLALKEPLGVEERELLLCAHLLGSAAPVIPRR